jgi:arylsulfatase A-like enzyme
MNLPLPPLLARSLLVSALLVTLPGRAVAASDPAKPNVLFIAVDDLKPLLGCYGEAIPTPNIDRIAARGTTFLNAHCQQAVCAPSRASLLTGRRPDFTRVWDLKTQIRDMRPGIVTLPQHFRSHGYETVGMGKIYDPRSVDRDSDGASWSTPYIEEHQLSYNKATGEPIGPYQAPEVRVAFAEIAPDGRKPGWNVMKRKLTDRNLWRATECADVPDDAYVDGALALEAVRRLPALASAGKPFFLAIGFKRPHLPFAAPKRYWDLFDRDSLPAAAFRGRAEGSPAYAYHDSNELREYSDVPREGSIPDALSKELVHGYHASVAYVDAQIGKILDVLESTGAAGNTIIVLWGDHGYPVPAPDRRARAPCTRGQERNPRRVRGHLPDSSGARRPPRAWTAGRIQPCACAGRSACGDQRVRNQPVSEGIAHGLRASDKDPSSDRMVLHNRSIHRRRDERPGCRGTLRLHHRSP